MDFVIEIVVRNWQLKIAFAGLVGWLISLLRTHLRSDWLPERHTKEGRDGLKAANQITALMALIALATFFVMLSLPDGV
jgi:hypothetical protein